MSTFILSNFKLFVKHGTHMATTPLRHQIIKQYQDKILTDYRNDEYLMQLQKTSQKTQNSLRCYLPCKNT